MQATGMVNDRLMTCRQHAQLGARTLDAIENGSEEVLSDEQTKALKRSLSTKQAYYLNPSEIA